MKQNFIAISILSLAVSIVIGSWFISNGLHANMYTESNEVAQAEHDIDEVKKKLLTQEELAAYLGLSIEEIKKLGPVGGGNGNTTSELPYVKIEQNVYFSKDAIDKWLVEDAVAHINY